MSAVKYIFPSLLLIAAMACHSPKPAAATSATQSSQAAPQPQQNYADQVQEIRFESTGRGYMKKVVFTPDSVFVVIRAMTTPDPKVKQKLSPEEWQQLNNSLSGIALDDIPKLESPTTGRQTDAALGSTITIYTGNKQYAHIFDNTNPNAKLQPLMDVITRIEKSKIAN